jgi:hypothetical protein
VVSSGQWEHEVPYLGWIGWIGPIGWIGWIGFCAGIGGKLFGRYALIDFSISRLPAK